MAAGVDDQPSAQALAIFAAQLDALVVVFERSETAGLQRHASGIETSEDLELQPTIVEQRVAALERPRTCGEASLGPRPAVTKSTADPKRLGVVEPKPVVTPPRCAQIGSENSDPDLAGKARVGQQQRRRPGADDPQLGLVRHRARLNRGDRRRKPWLSAGKSPHKVVGMARARPLLGVSLVAGLACSEQRQAPSDSTPQEKPEAQPERAAHDPLAVARASLGKLDNREAPIPPQCYTKTEGRANPCWVCHAPARFPNAMVDWDLQAAYSFSDEGKTNYWTNLFVDRRPAIAQISDEEILAWIRTDNYAALREALAALPEDEYRGYRPDLDFAAGFDEHGFARDGSHWRAFRYKPFPGAFWPTNGSADDVMIRLPPAFRTSADGQESRAVMQANLAILEASMGSNPLIADAALRWPIEPIDERAAGIDLDGDGELEAEVRDLVGLPSHYAGAAAKIRVRRGLYPKGTEFLHSVRYVDPDHGASVRMKELRYSRRFAELSDAKIYAAYQREAEEKEEGALPEFGGSPLTGLRNAYGWLLQGFIEDRDGQLRIQTEEEQYFCMGCHSNLGITADQSFAFPRKLPGADGWAYQDLRGIPDVPQVGHTRGEVALYLERALAGDEFRSNAEMIARWLNLDGSVNLATLAEAGELAAIVTPSRERALTLAKAYLVIVREQSFTRGRDPVIEPLTNVHRRIDEESTGLSEAKRVYLDGSLRLDWAYDPDR